MLRPRRLLVTLVFASALATAPGAQTPATLEIKGDVKTPLSLTAADLKAMPRTLLEVKDEAGKVTKYDGVLAGAILGRAGAALGAEMRGGAVSTYVVATASDGYQVVFSLAELDPAFTGSQILVADTADDRPLADRAGPFRMVVPKDARPARSIRMLQRLEVVQLKK